VKPNEYLQKIIEEQTLSEDSDELKELRQRRDDVEKLLKSRFSKSKPTIRYGGSKAKGTLIREAYDLDMICYFPCDEQEAGGTLKEIYENVRKVLEEEYFVEPKKSALRLMEKHPKTIRADYHIDVVPGRFTDESKSDVFIHQDGAEKERLKTNLDKHIEHIRDGGVTDAIRLLKLWKSRNYLRVKTFVLELLAVKILSEKKAEALSVQLEHIWTEFRDNKKNLSVEDPANPKGNDLTTLVDEARDELSSVAATTLSVIATSGWEAVFGELQKGKGNDEERAAALRSAAPYISRPTRPWREG
jgi:dihydroxyacetone kinase-like predicted kinase